MSLTKYGVLVVDGVMRSVKICNIERTFGKNPIAEVEVLDRLEGESITVTNDFTIGDIVTIENTGKLYTTRTEWILKYISDKELIAAYAFDDDLGYNDGIRRINGDTFIILVIAEHTAYIQALAYPHKCYQIGLNGIKKSKINF